MGIVGEIILAAGALAFGAGLALIFANTLLAWLDDKDWPEVSSFSVSRRLAAKNRIGQKARQWENDSRIGKWADRFLRFGTVFVISGGTLMFVTWISNK